VCKNQNLSKDFIIRDLTLPKFLCKIKFVFNFLLKVPEMSYKYLKKTTGLTKLNVAKNPHYTLGVLYGKILRTLQKMPEEASYRKYTEEIITNRAKIVQENVTVEDFEKKINCGQAEELIVQAENELVLTRKMLAFKPWESIIARPNADQWTWPPGK